MTGLLVKKCCCDGGGGEQSQVCLPCSCPEVLTISNGGFSATNHRPFEPDLVVSGLTGELYAQGFCRHAGTLVGDSDEGPIPFYTTIECVETTDPSDPGLPGSGLAWWYGYLRISGSQGGPGVNWAAPRIVNQDCSVGLTMPTVHVSPFPPDPGNTYWTVESGGSLSVGTI